MASAAASFWPPVAASYDPSPVLRSYRPTSLRLSPPTQIRASPRPRRPSVLDKRKVTINIGGRRYITRRGYLDKYPQTLLGSSEREFFYDSDAQEYTFEAADPDIFRYILNFYRTDVLHFPKAACWTTYNEEMEYFGIIPEIYMGDCCYEDYRHCSMRHNEEDFVRRKLLDRVGDNPHLSVRQRMWNVLQNRKGSTLGPVVNYVTGYFIAVSVISNIVETVKCGPPDGPTCGERYSWAFRCLDTVCVALFTIEFFARFFSAPDRMKFLKSFMTIIDILAIMPFYLGFLIKQDKIKRAFMTLRVCRSFRILRFSAASPGLRCLLYTLKKCIGEMLFLLLAVFMVALIFATLLYTTEKQSNTASTFSSVPEAFWFVIVTMTTLGYGDMVPRTNMGKLVAAACSVCGVILMTIPVTIIVTSFSRVYKKSQKAKKHGRQYDGKDNDDDDDDDDEGIG
ncbi:PREDICTED: potassium voltage-gated channel protein Shal-like [Branchiostoma belcheri]|uniref:Potassium voltage-gated channel protein Shal-like n=1 Tax=Branchiostoma belcheri TaxID=7741 RepID=A0A6P4Z094_BRABE|nr:PREDICTED: potassium voltage-gated channel protein Shal-like [Branchiostoma belcheri]